MVGVFRLNQHLARSICAAGPSGHLHDCLRQTFTRAKIGAEQSLVCIEHDDQRDIGKVVPLREHLRPDQNVHFPAIDSREDSLEIAFAAYTVTVQSC